MSQNRVVVPITWRRCLVPLAFSLFVLMAQIWFAQGAALAAPPYPQVQLSSPKAASMEPAVEPMTGFGTCSTPGTSCCPTNISANDYYWCQFNGFWAFGGGTLNVSVYVYSGLPSNMDSQLQQAITNWNNASTSVHFFITSSANAMIFIHPVTTATSCGGTWGWTSNTGSPAITRSDVNLYVENAGCSNNNGKGWISTSAHELGHALGLAHNNWYDSTNHTYMLMNSCSACNGSPQGPQSMDRQLIHAMYPSNLVAPSLSNYCSPNWSYYLDGAAHRTSGWFDSGHNIPASLAPLNAHYVSARGVGNSTTCNRALWSVSFSSGQVGDLHLWVPSNFAVVTSLLVTISEFDPVSGRRYSATVNIDEAPYTGFYYLGRYPQAINVIVYDSQAGPGGDALGIGPLQIS
jgi:hypothetical protein